MDLKLELLINEISDVVKKSLENSNIDINKTLESSSLSVLYEIKKIIINDELSDFDAIEAIVCLFEKYNIDSGSRHDF